METYVGLIAWLFSAMVYWVPPEHHDFYSKRAATEERYMSLAAAMVDAVTEDGPVFAGEDGIAKSVLVLGSLASFESAYNGKTGEGVSLVPGDNDNGAAIGYWQFHNDPQWTRGWTRKEMLEDPAKQARVALAMVRESFRVCADKQLHYKLGWYANGGPTCGPSNASVARMTRALRWWQAHPYKLGD